MSTNPTEQISRFLDNFQETF